MPLLLQVSSVLFKLQNCSSSLSLEGFFFSSSTSKIYILLVQGAGPEMNMPFMGQLFAKSPNVHMSKTHCSNLSMKNEETLASCLIQNLTPYFTVTWKLAGSSGGTAAKEAPGMGTGSSK